jgi:pantothenate kinase
MEKKLLTGSDADFQKSLKTINSAVYYTPGRKPWFDLEAKESVISPDSSSPVKLKSSSAFIIGIAGGSASGKTTVSEYPSRFFRMIFDA